MIPATTMLLAGCVALPSQPGAGASNPASPSAAVAPYSPGPPLMMTGNNYAMSPEGEAQPMQMDRNMDMKMNMPQHGGEPKKESGHAGHNKHSSEPEAGGQHQHHEENQPKQ